MKRILHWIPSLLILGLLEACKPYRALPLDAKAKEAAWASLDLTRIQVQAGELKHPILKPLAIDLSDGLSPEEAAVLAVLANPDLKAIRDQRALAAAQLLDAGLLPDPVLSYSQDVPAGSSRADYVTATTTQLSLDLTSLLTRGLRRRAARAQQESVDLEVAWEEWQVAEAAKLSVFRLSGIKPQVEMAEQVAGALEEILKTVENAAATGTATQGDVASARAAFDEGARTSLSLQQAEDREKQTLNALLGLPPHAVVALESPAKKRLWDKVPSEAEFLRGLDQRLDLVAFCKGYESQDAKVRLAVWSQFPSIGLNLSRAKDTSSVLTNGYGVAISLPLFNRGQGLVAVENASRQQLHDQYLSRLFLARSDVARILSDMSSVKHMIALVEDTLPTLEAQAKSSESAFKSGSLDLGSRNQARVALLTQQSTLAALKANLDELGLALEIASGRTLQPPEGSR